jgi:AraC-like DNA-binding protein
MRHKFVNIVEFSHVIELLDRHASPAIVDAALKSINIDRTLQSVPSGFVPYAAEAALLETVARAIGDPYLGARLGRDFDYRNYGAYAEFVLSAPNLVEALDRGRRALILTHPGLEISITETEQHLVIGRVAKGFSVLGHRHLDEGTLPIICYVARHFLGQDWRPDWVELPHDVTKDRIELEALFGARIRTGVAPAIAIRRTDLSAGNPDIRSPTVSLTFETLKELMGVDPMQTMEDAVSALLNISSATGSLTAENTAKLLGVESWTLRRALREEGTSFRALRNRFIARKACLLLADTDLPVEKIGEQLGYQEPKSFRRAFKSWTGLSPTDFRKSSNEQRTSRKT